MGLCGSTCLHVIESKKQHEDHQQSLFGGRAKTYEASKRTSVSLSSSSSSIYSRSHSKVLRRPSMVKSDSIPSIVVEVAPSRLKPNEIDSRYFKGSLESVKESRSNPSLSSLDSLLRPPSSTQHSNRRRDVP